MASRRMLALPFLLASAACIGGPSRDVTYSDHGDRATAALLAGFYTGAGTWYSCQGGCGAQNLDWGDDALTFALYLRWSTRKDPSLVPVFAALAATAASHAACSDPGCGDWSDVPEWDAIADEREFEVTGDARALELSTQAYASVRDSDAYGRGACPSIRYQLAFGGGGGIKTLETDSNAIKAALLLWKATGAQRYLDDARAVYAAVRQYFLDPALPLYTVYVYDDGATCTQLPGRFFASVNGNMIWNGVALASATGDARYLRDATQTAQAVDRSLSDGRGIFVDLQAENDVVEPLVEGFYALAVDAGVDTARAWILKNAQAAFAAAQTADGLVGRFFDGPVPTAPITAWQANGGLALAIAAAALAPDDAVPTGGGWSGATSIERDIATLPSSLTFVGSGIALFGTLGEQCCEPGHASVAIDGQTTTDQTGIWQNKSTAGRAFPDTLLFAWRWPASGAHVLEFGPSTTNVKEGGPFLHVQRYLILP
jgi:hypothetical protein